FLIAAPPRPKGLKHPSTPSMKTLQTPDSKKNAGFSMMELIIVLMILVTIAGIALPRFGTATDRANDTRRIADLSSVQKALDMYYLDNGAYPIVSGWSGDAPNYGGHGYTIADPYIPGLIPEYMEMLPRDPNKAFPDGGRGYLYKSNGKEYKLLAHKTPTSFPADHRYFDSARPTWAYQVSSKGGSSW
ncbi:MAG: prepilin-type N-terminal cleavage/methylation domain-containing protein, partial [Planctomycetota bacterium]